MELYDSLGPYYTKGMPEQTKAVTDGLFTPAEYLKQSDLVLQERVAALEYLLDEFREGFLFFYISTLDLDSHVLWHHQEPDHPAYDPSVSPRFADAICRRYERMDKILARVRGSLGPDDVLYVMSDHGFASLRREFNAISWLAQKGYLTYKSAVAKRVSRFYGGVDWSGTLAYGVGFNGLRVNRKGREATGIVEEEQYDQLVVELRDKLLALRDIDGKRVFSNVYRRDEIYTGPCVADGPDLVLGYNRGFGPSDGSVLGHWSEDVLADRVRGFTGHHAMDYKRVPGVLFCSRGIESAGARLQDVTVSVLRDFGVPPAAEMTGKPLRFRRIVKKGG